MFLDGLEIPGDAPKVATFHRNGGNFGPEWVATFKRNGGSFAPDYAKVEQTASPIHIYFPFIAQTQDEKMYRVVRDRERWFKIVMGEKMSLNARSTDRIAERLPLPESVAEELAFDLRV